MLIIARPVLKCVILEQIQGDAFSYKTIEELRETNCALNPTYLSYTIIISIIYYIGIFIYLTVNNKKFLKSSIFIKYSYNSILCNYIKKVFGVIYKIYLSENVNNIKQK